MANHIELLSRTEHASPSGIEIIRSFHVRQYQDHREVCKALRGYSVKDSRVLPARDTYIRNCYCMETRVDFAHEDATMSSESIQDIVGTAKDKVEGNVDAGTQKETTALGTAGAIVHAHYRPMVSSFKAEDPEETNTEAFDWLDFTSVPGFKQIQWPDGLFTVRDGNAVSLPDDLAEPIRIPVSDVSIRRVMVHEPPYQTMKVASGSVNSLSFPRPADQFTGMPTFEKGTLRFEGATIEPTIDSEGKRHWEVTNHYSWLNLYSTAVYNEGGNRQDGPVTWNHVFMRPSRWGFQGPMGWYFVHREADIKVGPFNVGLFRFSDGSLYKLFDMMQLHNMAAK